MERKLYDIHYHLFDLSHPNLLAFLLREDLISRKAVKDVMRKFPFILQLLPLGVFRFFPGKISEKIRSYVGHDAARIINLLSLMEGASEYHFLYTEYFLRQEKDLFGSDPSAVYNKIALCPLILDFGYKGMDKLDCFYYFPPAKPVVNQVLDLLTAIHFYYRYDLILHPTKPEKFKLIPTTQSKDEKLFEIYPFLGLNTKNYDLSDLVDLFDKYFSGYENDKTPGERRMKLYRKSGTVEADLEDMIFRKKEQADSSYYSYLFAGIKLYPPLGFDPWPEDDPDELAKVRFLYSECIRRKLPVTVHCSDGGFVADSATASFADPSQKWSKVLSDPRYSALKINFAHIGNQHRGKKEWQKTILDYISESKNIYTDCSCVTPGIEDYGKIKDLINADNESNILFGTDFIINLIWSDSYNQYLKNFIDNTSLDRRQKELISHVNPEKFLFG
jgi:hypothetical protein